MHARRAVLPHQSHAALVQLHVGKEVAAVELHAKKEVEDFEAPPAAK